MIKCFMVEPTGRARYFSGLMSKEQKCKDGWLHSGRVYGEWEPYNDGDPDWKGQPAYPESIACERCGFELTRANASRYGGYSQEWRNPTGETAEHPWTLGPGAMYFVRGKHCCFPHDPPCTEHLHVILPNGSEWDIDSRARNCTMPDDNVHHCWIREGVPPNVTVSKNGKTCQAGAGSIQSGNYHGFLQNGAFT